METITPILVEMGRFPKVYITAKTYYGCSESLAKSLIVGQSYMIETQSRTVPKKAGGTFEAKDIVSALSTTSSPDIVSTVLASRVGKTNPAPTDSNKAIRENMDVKNHAIAKACALNNASLLTDAYVKGCIAVDAFKGLNEQEIRDWMRSMKDSEYNDNLAKLGIEFNESETPF